MYYVVTNSIELVQSVLAEGDLLFAPALWRIQKIYPGGYACATTSMLGPSMADYDMDM